MIVLLKIALSFTIVQTIIIRICIRFYLYLKEVKKYMIFMQYITYEIPQIFSLNFSIYYYFETFYAKHLNS